ncbi:MAG: radical SAM protein [Candidatus Acidiferrum sp.]
MTFSLRLSADLALALAARAIGGKHSSPPILHLSPEGDFDSALASFSTSSPETGDASFQSVARVSRYRSPIIWIGGSEPLDHPQVAGFTNALAASGRQVFVETSGASLRRRLHEFQPSSRFYFTVRFDGYKPSHDRSIVSEHVFQTGFEAIRMARLAGFLTCASLVLHPETGTGRIEGLHAEIRKLDVDGFLITPGTFMPELLKEVIQVRRRLLPRRWAVISSLLDSRTAPATSQIFRNSERQPLPESQQESFGESAEA